jgi:two-component system, OmpR family, KDP operon response regulator KdpE
LASVLVVEDDPTLVRAIVRNLTARHYDTVSAGSVAEALAALEQVRPTVLLLDIDLPDGSGWDVLRALRTQEGDPVSVIVLSALRPNLRLIQEFGCFGMLEKPFPMESLLRLVGESRDRLDGQTSHEVIT